ncbi:MAG: TRAP transporter small permease [Pseudomonadota bacterium]
MRRLEQILIVIMKAMEYCASYILLPIIVVTVVTDVSLRFVFNAPLRWGIELNEFLLFPLFVLGLPQCCRTNGHIRMDLLASNMPPRLQGVFDACYALCGIFIFFLLARSSLEKFQFDFELDRVSDELSLPLWLPHLFLLALCCFLIFYFALRAVAGVLGRAEFSGPITVAKEN